MTPKTGIQRLADLLLLKEAEYRFKYLMAIEFPRYNVSLPQNGYFDESEKDNIVAVAGWLGSFEDWIRFEDRWCKTLPAEANRDFHYTDFWGRWSYGKEWTKEKRLEHVKTLAAIARDHTLVGVGLAIPKMAYETLVPLEVRQKLISPIHFCFAYCLTALLEVYEQLPSRPPAPLSFMFDSKEGEQGKIATMYYTVRYNFDQDHIFGDLCFGRRGGVPPLQAADLLAGELRRRYVDDNESEVMKVLRQKDSLLVGSPSEDEFKAYAERVLANWKRS